MRHLTDVEPLNDSLGKDADFLVIQGQEIALLSRGGCCGISGPREQFFANGDALCAEFVVGEAVMAYLFFVKSDELRFIASRLTGLSGNINVSWIQEVRYVLIPGGIPVGNLEVGPQAELDYRDYEAVAAYFGIPEEGSGIVRE